MTSSSRPALGRMSCTHRVKIDSVNTEGIVKLVINTDHCVPPGGAESNSIVTGLSFHKVAFGISAQKTISALVCIVSKADLDSYLR